MADKEKINLFWDWFVRHQDQYRVLNKLEDEVEKEQLLYDLVGQLHLVCDALYFSISGHPSGAPVELVITAEGRIEYFGQVEDLIEAAPDLPDWKFTAFRQPMEPGFILEYEGISFNPAELFFSPQPVPEIELGLNIVIYYPDFPVDKHAIYVAGTLVILDNLIGEKPSLLDLNNVEIAKLPDDRSEGEFYPLDELPGFIREWKAIHGLD